MGRDPWAAEQELALEREKLEAQEKLVLASDKRQKQKEYLKQWLSNAWKSACVKKCVREIMRERSVWLSKMREILREIILRASKNA